MLKGYTVHTHNKKFGNIWNSSEFIMHHTCHEKLIFKK